MDATRDSQIDTNTLPLNGFRLVTLGALALVNGRGDSDGALAKRRRKLAVLAVLAVARRPMSRERLAEMFWGEEDEARARHSLSDALSSLRRILGPDSIATRQLEVLVSPTCPLQVDALELMAAADRRDYGRVVELYRGPFLDAVTVGESASFEHWVSRVRGQLQRVWLDACAHRCLALARGRRWDECAALARRWLDADALNADAALYLLNAIKAPGTVDAYQRALDEYASLEQRLQREVERSPAHEVARLASSIQQELATRISVQRDAQTAAPPVSDTTTVLVSATVPTPVHHRPDVLRPARWRHGAIVSRLASVSLAGLLFIAAASLTARRAASRPARDDPGERPSVAVVDVRSLAGDSATSWLELALPQMVSSDAARVPEIDVIAPDRVRQARQALALPHGTALSRGDRVRLGGRIGAAWVVSASVARGDSLYVLDVTVHDVSGRTPPRLFTVTSPSPIALADQAAARLAGLARTGGAAQGFADVETSSVEAYEHYARARQANDEGRLSDAVRELDGAIGLDSSFVSALADRIPAAVVNGESDVIRRLNARLASSIEHAGPFDRLLDAADRAKHNGEHRRAEVLARELVARYPRDPRAYGMLADLYTLHGRWDAADSVLTSELALDSLATFAGAGPCAPCVAYSGLSTLRVMRGDMHGAVHAAQRWVDLQPDVPAAWSSLMALLTFDGRFDAALDAYRRAGALANYSTSLARILIMARRYDEADSVIAAALRASERRGSREARAEAMDVRALLERERGEFRRSARTVDAAVALDSGAAALRLMAANSLARVGDYASARAIYTSRTPATSASPVDRPAAADDARSFTWHHALLADAIAAVADTTELRALADSIEQAAARSYYGRDWRLHHHVLGLIAMRRGDWAVAEHEFSAARWGVAGWTVSVVDLARAQLSLGRATDAVATLRDAYKGPLDAMGRYEPRSEIDYWMSVAFARADAADSARTYAGYVRRAWRNADPEVKRQLGALVR